MLPENNQDTNGRVNGAAAPVRPPTLGNLAERADSAAYALLGYAGDAEDAAYAAARIAAELERRAAAKRRRDARYRARRRSRRPSRPPIPSLAEFVLDYDEAEGS